MKNRLATEAVINANLLLMLLTFHFFHTEATIVRTGLSVNWVILPTRRRKATRVPQMARDGDAEARHPSLRQGKQVPLFLIIRKMNPRRVGGQEI
jgi:hypothetical protein